jgi:hypothetical protein
MEPVVAKGGAEQQPEKQQMSALTANRSDEEPWPMTPTWTFPCNADKSPISRHGFKDAFQWMEWRKAPLVGAPTGERNGFDVLDIDPDGMGWYALHFGAIPETRRHETPRGVHLLFSYAPGLRGSVGRVAPGVDVRAEGNFVIWWPREGLAVDDWPVGDWPEWLLEAARAARGTKGPPRHSPPHNEGSHNGVEVANLTDALRQMNPVDWRGDFEPWFALAGACKAVGIEREEFVEWSVGDTEYAERRGEIERIWDCALGAHGRALYKALSERGIKVPSKRVSRGSGGHTFTPTGNLQRRTEGLIAHLAASPTEDRLFTVAATFGEIILEERIQRWVANDLLEGACQANGLWKLLGPDRCRRTIANGFRHVEEKFLGERE